MENVHLAEGGGANGFIHRAPVTGNKEVYTTDGD